jgi:hypothetical protein
MNQKLGAGKTGVGCRDSVPRVGFDECNLRCGVHTLNSERCLALRDDALAQTCQGRSKPCCVYAAQASTQTV